MAVRERAAWETREALEEERGSQRGNLLEGELGGNIVRKLDPVSVVMYRQANRSYRWRVGLQT